MFDDYAENSSHSHNWKLPSMKPGSARLLAVLLIFVLMIPVAYIMGNSDLKYSGHSIFDPSTKIWSDTLVSDDFKEVFSSITSTTCDTDRCRIIQQQPVFPSIASIALSKNSIGDLGIAAGKELDIIMAFNLNSTAGCCGSSAWGWYLTRNSTLPSVPTFYDPRNDTSVALMAYMKSAGGSAFTEQLYIQRESTTSILSQDPGNCNPSGSCFISCGGGSLTTQGQALTVQYLNFTGNAGQGGNNGASQLQVGTAGGGTTCSTSTFPFFRISQIYYLGFWLAAGSTNAVDWFQFGSIGGGGFILNSMVIHEALPTAAAPVPPPPTVQDTGFIATTLRGFGMIWHQVGGYAGSITEPLANWAGGLEGAIVAAYGAFIQVMAIAVQTVLNSFGSFFGLGPIGTQFITFLNGVGQWFFSVVGGAFSRIIDLAGGAANMILTLTGLFTNGFWNMISGGIGGFISLFGSLKTLWDAMVHFLAITGLGFSYFFIIDWLFGMFEVYRLGIEGLNKWLDFNELIFIKLFRGTYWFVDESAELIRLIKQTVDPIG